MHSIRSVTSGLRRAFAFTCAVRDAAVSAENAAPRGGESMAPLGVNCSLAPTHQRRARGCYEVNLFELLSK